MIVSSLEGIERRISMTPGLSTAFAFLRRPDIHEIPDGKVPIDGEKVFAIVQRYHTIASDAPNFEHHLEYIDVQFIASGREIIGWAPVERMAITEVYDPEKDIAFGTVEPVHWTPLVLQTGQAAVFFPEDGHAPKLAKGNSSAVTKIVVKVAV